MTPEKILTNMVIEEALKKDLGDTVALASWDHADCSAVGDNFFNVVKRITVKYTEGGSEKDITYIAKLNPCKTNDTFNPYRERAMTKEVFFYETLLPALNSELAKMGVQNLRAPRYIHSSIVAEKEVIILEDLQPKGFVTFPQGKEMDEAHSELLAKEIGKLHAASFSLEKTLGNAKLEEAYPLLVESWFVGDMHLREAFEQVFTKGLNHNLNLIKSMNEFEELIPWFQSLNKKEMEFLAKEMHSTSPWRVICHGDYHRTNVLYRYDNSIPVEIMIIDWQTVRVANIGSEISYLLFSSYFGPLRCQMLPLITKTYFDTYSRLLGSNTLFTHEELETEVMNNHFGLIICFYLMPLSLCVSNPSELFKLDKTAKNAGEKDELLAAKEFLKANKRLSFVLTDYLQHIYNSSMWKN